MKFLPIPKPRLRQVLPAAAACVAAACWFLAARAPAPHAQESGAAGTAATGATEKRGSRPVLPVPGEAVAAWKSTARSGEADSGLSAAITITGRRSAARGAAFDKLLGLLREGNAAEFHRLLTAADEEGAGLTDEEWRALLEKWGRLDGAGAAACLDGVPDGYRRLPGVIRGWASIDPTAASAWLKDHGSRDPAWQTAAQKELAIGWLQVDPEAAAAWLNQQRAAPGYGEIAAAFADQAAAIDPENALEWAATVEGPAHAWAVEAIGRRWLERNETEAREGLRAAGYPREKIDLWKEDPAWGYDLLDSPNGELPGLSIAEEP